jgi:hypothetical protein
MAAVHRMSSSDCTREDTKPLSGMHWVECTQFKNEEMKPMRGSSPRQQGVSNSSEAPKDR